MQGDERLPPFLAGQAAFKRGEKITANPHPVSIEPEPGDAYPGPFHNWRDGWRLAKMEKSHAEKLRNDKDK